MKSIHTFFLVTGIFAIAGMVLLASCKKTAVNSGTGNLLFVQASPDAPAIDIRNVSLTGVTWSSENITGATGLSYTSGTPNSGYITMNASTYSLGVYSSGASVSITPTLSANGFVITPGMTSSVFVMNRLSVLMVSVIKDNLDPPESGKAKIRFLHLSPDGPNLNVFTAMNAASPAPTTIPATATAVFSNRSFNDQNTNTSTQDFISVPTGYYRIEIRNTTGPTITTLTLTNQLLDNGRIYTIYVRGLVTPPTGNTNTLSTKVLINY